MACSLACMSSALEKRVVAGGDDALKGGRVSALPFAPPPVGVSSVSLVLGQSNQKEKDSGAPVNERDSKPPERISNTIGDGRNGDETGGSNHWPSCLASASSTRARRSCKSAARPLGSAKPRRVSRAERRSPRPLSFSPSASKVWPRRALVQATLLMRDGSPCSSNGSHVSIARS